MFDISILWRQTKLFKNWETLLALVAIIFVYKIFCRRLNNPNKENIKSNKQNLDGAEDIAVDFNEADTSAEELKPALEEKPHVVFVPGDNLNPDGAVKFYKLMRGRRSIRKFSTKPIPFSIIEKCILAAGTAPSGAHTEPWTFCVIESSKIKEKIREIVEYEEEINYSSRMHAQWVTDLRPFKTRPVKQYLSDAPYLILVFKQIYGHTPDGRKKQHYYNEISTSIATGILLCALQAAGLCSLVTTPLNCGVALRNLLDRPINEKLLILLAVGYAAEDCMVPDLKRKPIEEIMLKY